MKGRKNLQLKIYSGGRDPPESLVGTICNDLTVDRKTTERQNGHVIYECSCICGRKVRVRATRIVNKLQKSCGKCQKNAGTISPTLRFTKE